jgi:4-hydroxythreonine-4-phosphate dehydrogenase
MVTAPLNKEAVTLNGMPFSGHTEFIAELCGAAESRMLLASERLATVHVTTHVPLRRACELNTERIFRTIELGHDAMKLLGFDSPRIAVCGLNPHAGEHGLFGEEDERSIAPAIRAAQAAGMRCTGPHAGDTVFLQGSRGAYDLIVAMYHDQGHIPVKIKGFNYDAKKKVWTSVNGINVSLGLPIIRTSVDHGTAFDQAGKGTASDASLLDAIDYAAKLSAGS